MIAAFVKKTNPRLLIVLLLLSTTSIARTQFLPKLTKKVGESADLIRNLTRLVDATKRTTAEFNNHVTVVKGNPTPPAPKGAGRPVPPVPVVGKVTEPKFKNGKFSGKGTFYYKNGDKYEGEFEDDKKHGEGMYYFADGKIMEGQWENDLFNFPEID